MSARSFIATRFTECFGVNYPIALAPMDKVAGGKLAAAVANAGGLGLIGGGYLDEAWIETAFTDAGNAPVGVGVITWSALENMELLEQILEREPKALMVSFGDASAIVQKARTKGIKTLWQVQTLDDAKKAIASGVDVIVAQGQEAGGHGMGRGLISLLPAIRDAAGDDQIILGAGGAADGRGLAAILSLGGDGVLMGTRFWACQEASGPDEAKELMLKIGGDDTVRSKVFDIVRNVRWPSHFNGRVVRNEFLQKWHNNISELRSCAETERQRYEQSLATDFSTRVLIAGEALDLISDLPTAEDVITRTCTEACALLNKNPRIQVEAGL